MALESIRIPETLKLTPVITVFGVGGAGCNAVQNMMGKGLKGVEFVIANTDAQSLSVSSVDTKIQLGPNTTKGLGAGADPVIGLKSAEESSDQIRESLEGVHMVFITAGMGGGTGTGAAPAIAKIAREMDILTVGVVTKPFIFEGGHRLTVAEAGIQELRRAVHTSVVISNQNLFQVSNERTTTTEAFMKADDVLYEGVKSITDLMVRPGRINLDFADVRAVMLEMGSALMGTGEDSGDNRAKIAAKRAMTNQLLEETRLSAATGVLINIIGGNDLTLFDLNDASEEVRDGINPDARIIIGSTIDPEYDGTVKVSLLAAGLNSEGLDSDMEPLMTTLPDASEIWEADDESNESDDGGHFEDDFPAEPGFDPSAAWPHSREPAQAESQIEPAPPHEAETVVEPQPAQLAAERRARLYIAPKAASGDSSERFQPDAAGENGPEPEQSGGSRSARRHLSSVIRRMRSGPELEAEAESGSEPAFTSEMFEGSETAAGERTDEERRVPAFMRRQAN